MTVPLAKSSSNTLSKLNSHISTFGAGIMRTVLAMTSGIAIARLLGATGKGELLVVYLWPNILATVGNLGIENAITYYVASDRATAGRSIGAAYLLLIPQSILLVSLGYIVVPLVLRQHRPEVLAAAHLFLWFIPLELATVYSRAALQGSSEMTWRNVVSVLTNVLYLLSVGSLVWQDCVSITSLACGLLISRGLTMLTALILVVTKLRPSLPRSRVIWKRLLTYGLRSHIGSVANMLNVQMDQTLVSIFLSPTQLGLYSVAMTAGGVAKTLSLAFEVVSFPAVSSVESAAKTQVVTWHSRAHLTLLLAMSACLALALPFAIPLLYTQEFGPAIVPAEILCIATIFLGLGRVWGAGLKGMGKPEESSKAELLGTGITLLGLAFLLPPFGILGAAIVSLIAYAGSATYLILRLVALGQLRVKDLIGLARVTPAQVNQYVRQVFVRRM